MSSYTERLDRLGRLIQGFKAQGQHEAFVDLLKGVTLVVREADNAGAPELPQVVDKAGDILSKAVNWAYSEGDFDFLPSYAHSFENPPVKDSLSLETRRARQAASDFIAQFERMFFGRASGEPTRLTDNQLSKPWPDTPHPHPKTTRLFRFRGGVPVTSTADAPIAQTIYQARCEITSDTLNSPINFAMTANASALAVIQQGGWKNREPLLTVYFLDDEADFAGKGKADEDDAEILSWHGFRYMGLECGLSEVAYEVAMDTPRQLAVVADSRRIKTFALGGDVAFNGWKPALGKNVHTMKSAGYDGPLVVLPEGRIARAGKGGAAIWNLDSLETHKGGKRVGRGKFDIEHSMRDTDTDIELSTGSAPTTTLTFARSTLTPASWHLHEPSGHILSGENGNKSHSYGCYSLDLNAGGKIVSQYLGHGGNVIAFSTSPGDPNVFVTACGDGFARLYDVRHPLPVMTIDSGKSSEFCSTVQFIHPDGIPTVFTGSDRYQNIMMWDVRARSLVYELATGNNAVRALCWDAKRTTLYAATECDYMDRLGFTHGYRAAHIPGWAKRMPEPEPVRGPDDDDDDDEGDGEHCWPENAPHEERYFGYAYDAGEHTLLRYQFKEDPKPDVLPEYGRAEMGDGFW
ncbi:hypothetical protein C8Q70DRAFT_1052118 [Cubamyces menziesii]|nr:hypothetical protein C8Q70DRAFT_1052118 [Cubamyces menziesii]